MKTQLHLRPKSYCLSIEKIKQKEDMHVDITHRFMDKHRRIATLPLRIRIRKNLSYIRKT